MLICSSLSLFVVAMLADVSTFADTQANVFTANAQDHASVAVDPTSGVSLVVWGSRRQEQGGYGVFGRLLDKAGEPIGSEIHINQYMINNQQDPATAFASDGTATVVWQSFLQDGDAGGIVMRRFKAGNDGTFAALSEETIVNVVRKGDQTAPSIATSGDRTLVLWESREQRNGEWITLSKMRIFDLMGKAVSGELMVSEQASQLPSAAAQPDGGFVVVFAKGNGREIRGQRFDRTGIRVGDEILVSSNREQWAIEPAIASAPDGSFVIGWMGRNDSRGWDVLARRFDVSGHPLTPDVTVASCGQNAWSSGIDVATADDGSFTVVFNREANGPLNVREKNPDTPADVVAVRFDSNGSAISKETRANAQIRGRQTLTIGTNQKRVAWRESDKSFVLSWEGAIGDDRSGIGISVLPTSHGENCPYIHERTIREVTSIDPTILADNTLANVKFVGRFPPDYDPFFVPEPPDLNIFNPGGDFGFQAFQNTGWNPPDPDLACGPNHVVVAVNGGIRFFDKQGNLTFADDISGPGGFWGDVGANTFVFDPVCVFDVHSQRFIVATTEHADNGNDLINLAVSDDDDPNGIWHKYRFNLSSVGDFIDFPNLGVGPDAIYVCCDYFSVPTGNHIHIFDKTDVLNGLPTTPTVLRTSSGFRSLGAVNHMTNDAPAQYFATAFDGNNSQIGLDAVRDPNGSPIRNTFLLGVPSFSQPPDAEQLGTSNRASTVDMRIKNGVYRDGFLWLAHTIGESGTARVRWYQVDMNGWPTSGQNPTLVDSGTQNLGTGVYNWFPDISVDEFGTVGIAFNQSSSSEFISIQRTFRLPSDPPGTLRTPELMQTSDSPETGSRWGDYGGIEADPVVPGIFWNHHEYRTSGWRTWVGAFDVVVPLSFQYPNGIPSVIDSDGGTGFLVQIVDQAQMAEPGTAKLHVNDGSGFLEYPMIDLGNNLYDAVFPAVACGVRVQFYVSVETTDKEIITDPNDAPATFYSADAYADVFTVVSDDFETNMGWTVENIDLTDGAWERGVPVGDGSRGDPTTDFDGSGQCMLTDNAAGNSDVDGGPTRLISPVFDLAGEENVSISYARWFTNDDGDGDRLNVEISNNSGATWTLVESVSGNGGGWTEFEFNPANFVALTDQMRVRFSATDNPNDSVTEAAIDAFAVIVRECGGPVCASDGVLVEGTSQVGDFGATCGSDDSYWAAHGSSLFYQISDPVVQFELTTTATAGANSISVDIEASKQNNGASLNLRASLYNHATGSYVSLPGVLGLTTTDTSQNFALPVGSDPADFIEPGTNEVRLLLQTIQTSGLPNVRTQVDQVLFNFE